MPYGCLNNADSSMTESGYWTISPGATGFSSAWRVGRVGSLGTWGISILNSVNVDSNGGVFVNDCGVRPVITVLKSKLN